MRQSSRAGRKRPARPRPRGGPDRGPAQRRRSRKPNGANGLRARRWRTPFHTFPRNRGQRTAGSLPSGFFARSGLPRREVRYGLERRSPDRHAQRSALRTAQPHPEQGGSHPDRHRGAPRPARRDTKHPRGRTAWNAPPAPPARSAANVATPSILTTRTARSGGLWPASTAERRSKPHASTTFASSYVRRKCSSRNSGATRGRSVRPPR